MTIAALVGFGPGIAGPFPTPVIAFMVVVVAGLAGWLAWPAFRRALLSIPLVALVGINGVRVAGVFLLILHALGRLAAPFSTSAGWGDIIAGAIAIPAAALMTSKGTAPRWLFRRVANGAIPFGNQENTRLGFAPYRLTLNVQSFLVPAGRSSERCSKRPAR